MAGQPRPGFFTGKRWLVAVITAAAVVPSVWWYSYDAGQTLDTYRADMAGHHSTILEAAARLGDTLADFDANDADDLDIVRAVMEELEPSLVLEMGFAGVPADYDAAHATYLEGLNRCEAGLVGNEKHSLRGIAAGPLVKQGNPGVNECDGFFYPHHGTGRAYPWGLCQGL